ncbi:MAG TPA: N-acetylmuramic acid 6-phosphate etherase [Terriglobales bacterium]|nr:N-acetylmuramic acid 6-phosphate etherase [Terriglobales bacterium]
MTAHRTPRENLQNLATEQPNRASAALDSKPALGIARLINREDAKVARAVRRALPAIAHAIDWIADAFRAGGRLIYVGTGTSGRIAALDAAECPPTFNTDPRMVQFIIAGGRRALGAAVESNEDSREAGEHAMAKKKPDAHDVAIGIAASGRTPFTVAALAYARRQGAKTVAVTCNRNSPLEEAADVAIVTEVGPEVVAGSTRMKAGTAQKMVLNMLSTGALTRLGYVYGNLMVNVRPRNSKLRERGIGILQKVTGVPRRTAERILLKAGSTAVALVMIKAGVGKETAEWALDRSQQNVSSAIQAAKAEVRAGKSKSSRPTRRRNSGAS